MQPDSLMDLLIGQCSDLEALLTLARRETLAAEQSDFSELMTVVEERASLGERLETYHRQIAELRGQMAGEQTAHDPVAKNTVRLAVEIQAIDKRTTALLATNRLETREAIARLDQGKRQFVAYLSDARLNGLNCDRRG